VAYGAAVQAALLSSDIKNGPNLVLRDVTPLSLGTSVDNSIPGVITFFEMLAMDVLIPKNSTIPIMKTKEYVTSLDNQSSIFVDVYEGERKIAKDNNLLGSFTFPVPPAPQGHIPIKVCFAIDADGILNVSAEEETSGNKKDITITKENGRLSTEEIDRMIQEAGNFNAEDMKLEQKAKTMNDLNDYLYHVKKLIADNDVSALICPVDKLKIYTAVVKGQKLLDGNKHEETHVFVDFLKEFQDMVDSTLYKITKGV
jgi:L1 cell adhesion molecule like protein